MRIFITGGTGFIGRYFVHDLLAMGHEVVAYDLYPFEDGVPEIDVSKVTYIRGDIRNKEHMAQSMKGCDAVLHLAAAHHDFGISEATFKNVNVEGAKSLCEAMDQNGISNLCFYSSVAIYGVATPPVDEDSPTNATSHYGTTKRDAEKVFRAWIEAGGNDPTKRRCFTMRPTVTFGMGNFANMFTLIKQIETGRYLPVGAGENIKSLSFVENIVDAVLTLWIKKGPDQSSAYSAYNYVCQPDLSSGQISKIIYESLGKKPPGFSVPYWLARVLALPFDLVIAVTGKNLPVSGARIKKMAKSRTQYESKRIREAGFEQKTSLEDGIKKMVRWYLESGKEEAAKGVKRRLPPETPAAPESSSTR